jgi:hypothetical protein
MKKIKLGANRSKFLIPQTEANLYASLHNSDIIEPEASDLVMYKDHMCLISKVNWVAYEVVLATNNSKFIEYEIETMQWLW